MISLLFLGRSSTIFRILETRLKPAVLLLCTLLACFARDAAGLPNEHPSGSPNIVLIIADDVAWNNWGYMGDSIVQTPRIDALAAAGTVYEHGMAPASVCRPSLETLLYGLYPREVERRRLTFPGPPGVREQVRFWTTLPERLRTRGYVSFQGGKHWEGTFAEAGFDAGTVDELVAFHPSFRTFGRPSIQPVWDFLDSKRGAPFFLWFAPMLPHYPIDPPGEFVALYQGRGLSEDAVQWFANITRFDAITGQLLDGLAARGFDRSNTVFIVVTDNGWEQAPYENHPLGKVLGGPNGKLSIQEMGWRTSVVLTGPGFPKIHYGADHLVNFRHVFSTILDVAGLGFGEFGESLAAGPPRREVRVYGARNFYRQERWPNWSVPGNSSFVRTTHWRLTRRSDRPTVLHDITIDPFTVNDVSAEHPKIVSELVADLDKWIAAGPESGISAYLRDHPQSADGVGVRRPQGSAGEPRRVP